MTVLLYKMARVECDYCHSAHFDVYTHDCTAEAPEGWKLILSYGWGSGYSRRILCCPPCVEQAIKDRENKIHDHNLSLN